MDGRSIDDMEQLLSSDLEDEPLLSPLPRMNTVIRKQAFRINLLPRQLCLPSKAAVLILLWTAVVSAVYAIATEGAGIAAQLLQPNIHINSVEKANFNERIFIAYFCLAVASIFYPFAGYVADVCTGRYKMVVISLVLLLCAFFVLSLDSILRLVTSHHSIPVLVLGYLLSVTGLAGYQANFIQLGLDQLLDAPNEYQGLFVHWVQWFSMLGIALTEILFSWYRCSDDERAGLAVRSSPFLIVVLLSVLLLVTFCLRRSFYSRNRGKSPYGVVFRVLNFARKHAYPLRPGAFDYCEDDECPSRIDFAKDRYGGPYTSEQVEDVKMFIRILIVLLVLGPVFVLDIPANAIFTLFAQHFTINRHKDRANCTLTWAVMDSGALKYLTAVLMFIVYIWLVYSVLRNCIPKMFVRLWVSHFLFVLGALSLLVIDFIGHVLHHYHSHENAVCMFIASVQYSPKMALGMHWAVLIVPNLMIGVAPFLVMTTTFEFISAQSPHSMTGLFIGLFLAIRGFFQFIGSVFLYPLFSLDKFWKSNEPMILTCGFGYLCFTCVVGLLSLVFLTIVVKRYKYRERIK